jgi:hypothetical protein
MNKNLIARIVTVVVVTLAGAALAWADEGKIPLFEPTTITEPGHYIVTRDISSATGPIFDIQADNVRLDLGGHRLSLSDTTTDVIKITNGSEKGIIIIDGRIHGGRNGVARMTQPLDKILLTTIWACWREGGSASSATARRWISRAARPARISARRGSSAPTSRQTAGSSPRWSRHSFMRAR